jgi:hypothetical protein
VVGHCLPGLIDPTRALTWPESALVLFGVLELVSAVNLSNRLPCVAGSVSLRAGLHPDEKNQLA